MKQIIILSLIAFSVISCQNSMNLSDNKIIPEPLSVKPLRGEMRVDANTGFSFDPGDPVLSSISAQFSIDLKNRTGIELTSFPREKKNTIFLNYPVNGMDEEAYSLRISKTGILVSASDYKGIFYGLQSLMQVIITNQEDSCSTISAMEINDKPRFKWRGMHLDVGRHFMSVEDVKKYIDYMALYKFNNFHWHLTEDQGWRIEIKKYPLLTEIGAWRDETILGHFNDKPRKYDGLKHGGYYSQDEIREVVQYAASRFINVVPEIEMPGHARAAIASYPQLGVTGEKISVMKEWGISPYIFKPSEETFGFLFDVLTEVMDLFPSEFIHIGGDEAIKDQWKSSPEVQNLIADLGLKDEHELQSWFITKIDHFLTAHNRRLIGWDEILEGGLAPNAAVMSWRGEEGGIAAAKMGHDVVMSPTSKCYFDYYQAGPGGEPLAIGGFLPIDSVYSYDPVPAALSPTEKKHILGVQANVWTEYIPDFRQVEYMIFPRMLAMSEVAWTIPENKNPDQFRNKVHMHIPVFNALGVNYSRTGMPTVDSGNN